MGGASAQTRHSTHDYTPPSDESYYQEFEQPVNGFGPGNDEHPQYLQVPNSTVVAAVWTRIIEEKSTIQARIFNWDGETLSPITNDIQVSPYGNANYNSPFLHFNEANQSFSITYRKNDGKPFISSLTTSGDLTGNGIQVPSVPKKADRVDFNHASGRLVATFVHPDDKTLKANSYQYQPSNSTLPIKLEATTIVSAPQHSGKVLEGATTVTSGKLTSVYSEDEAGIPRTWGRSFNGTLGEMSETVHTEPDGVPLVSNLRIVSQPNMPFALITGITANDATAMTIINTNSTTPTVEASSVIPGLEVQNAIFFDGTILVIDTNQQAQQLSQVGDTIELVTAKVSFAPDVTDCVLGELVERDNITTGNVTYLLETVQPATVCSQAEVSPYSNSSISAFGLAPRLWPLVGDTLAPTPYQTANGTYSNVTSYIPTPGPIMLSQGSSGPQTPAFYGAIGGLWSLLSSALSIASNAYATRSNGVVNGNLDPRFSEQLKLANGDPEALARLPQIPVSCRIKESSHSERVLSEQQQQRTEGLGLA